MSDIGLMAKLLFLEQENGRRLSVVFYIGFFFFFLEQENERRLSVVFYIGFFF